MKARVVSLLLVVIITAVFSISYVSASFSSLIGFPFSNPITKNSASDVGVSIDASPAGSDGNGPEPPVPNYVISTSVRHLYGNDSVSFQLNHGIASYNFSTNKFTLIYSTRSNMTLQPESGFSVGTMHIIPPGYYVTWIRIESKQDRVQFNNLDYEFFQVE